MAGNDLFVRFWGVRGSYAVPGQNTMRHGGNTSCIEVRAKNHIIILDAGTGIINLGHRMMDEIKQADPAKPFAINILFSHTHHDHIQGLPYFAPAYHSNCVLNLFGPRTYSQDLRQSLSFNMAPQYSPIELEELHSTININNITDNHLLVFEGNAAAPSVLTANGIEQKATNGVRILIQRNYAHPKVGTFIFRIEANGKSIVYATDTEGYIGGDKRLIDFAKDANLLIHDAQYDPEEYLECQGFGHSTYEMAAQLAEAANVENLVLFHHDPCHDDDRLSQMEAKARELFPNTTAGAEGLEFAF